MLDRVTGRVVEGNADGGVGSVLVDVHGFCLRLDTSPSLATRVTPGAEVTILTQLFMPTGSGGGDPTPRLFGFADADERLLFRLLLGVAGIGPSHALRILGTASAPSGVAAAIARGDAAALKVKGIGPKLTKRVVAELKDKVDGLATTQPALGSGAVQRPAVAAALPEDEALRALRALELDGQEAARLLDDARRALGEQATTEDLVRAVLERV